MKASTLFVLGLAVGGLVVFGIRAASLDTPTPLPHEGHPPRESPPALLPHANHESTSHREKPPAGMSDTAEMPTSDAAPENAICPVMGNPVDPEVYVDYKGRRIGFCCPGCDDLFLEDPEQYLEKVDAELAEREGDDTEDGPGDAPASPDAPANDDKPPENEICPVMGNPVDPEVYVDYKGRRIGFCCPGCDSVFLEDPETYLKKVDAELEKRGAK